MELAYGRAPYAKFPPMKVMVLTLQEEPPTADIYKDHSYEFSSHFHSMVAKCLRKDPSKRPSVKKLLEHKFFKSARDKQYLVDKIIKKMPVKRFPANPKLLNICELRHRTVARDVDDGEKGKPVSVGSWVFDKNEFDQLKLQATLEKESSGSHVARVASVQASYADEEPTPKGARPPGTGAVGSNHLAVPNAGAPQHVRTPSAGVLSSADDSGSSSETEEASDEEHHRPLPDFSDPSGGARSSQQPASVRVQQASGGHSGDHSPVTSPGVEHQAGRFRVCDDEESSANALSPHQVGLRDDPGYDRYHTHQQQEQPNAFPAFHNEAYTEDDQGDAAETQQVGRFAISEDQ
jgi:serine/threonine protein kinase